MSHPVAIVTGANRSLGLQVAKNLYAKGFSVVLAVRDPSKGQAVLDEIAKAYEGPALGNKLSVIRLDLGDASSIPLAVEEFKKSNSRLDVLVNNAAIYIEDRKETFKVNYYNTVAVTEAFLPLLAVPKPDRKIKSRVVIVSSRMGCFDGASIKGDALAALLEHKDQAKIDALAKAWENGDDSTGFGFGAMDAAYSNSKALLSTYSRILAQRVADQKLPVNVFVTCPGYVATDLNGHSGHKTVEDGADTLSWVAYEESIENSSGKFFAERHEIPYETFDRSVLAKKPDQ
eukprot:GILI01001948.1.p1 GENE.GILI01001948.1~~GILI01001948.1.p1  ORF type:complete len:304 (-),score=111.11 GILI01001948.1:467-1330(-)